MECAARAENAADAAAAAAAALSLVARPAAPPPASAGTSGGAGSSSAEASTDDATDDARAAVVEARHWADTAEAAADVSTQEKSASEAAVAVAKAAARRAPRGRGSGDRGGRGPGGREAHEELGAATAALSAAKAEAPEGMAVDNAAPPVLFTETPARPDIVGGIATAAARRGTLTLADVARASSRERRSASGRTARR